MAKTLKKICENLRNLREKLTSFLSRLWNFRELYRIKKFNRKLAVEVTKQNIDRKAFLKEFRNFLRIYLKKDASGKYIPLKGKNKAEIYEAVQAKYAKELKALSLTFTKELKLR